MWPGSLSFAAPPCDDGPPMARILLTGGRAPATLELCRLFRRAGHEVFVAESLRGQLSFPSRAVTRTHHIPPPNDGLREFSAALQRIARREGIDLLVPTCEEVFHVSRCRDALAEVCGVFTAPIATLRRLHSKWEFQQVVAALGWPTPATRLVTTRDALVTEATSGRDVVLKPVFSRFATSTILRPRRAADVASAVISPERPWVSQDYVEGRHLCTWSVAHDGHLTAHAAYGVEFKAGQGATIVFERLDHPAACAWVRDFVAAERFTGQIAFDFIDGDALYAIECNPRATSGIHLFGDDPHLARAFLEPAAPTLEPAEDARPAMLAIAMLLYALPAVRSLGGLRRFLEVFGRSREVVFDASDPLPFALQLVGIGELGAVALRRGVGLLEASTLDIEWNGQLDA